MYNYRVGERKGGTERGESVCVCVVVGGGGGGLELFFQAWLLSSWRQDTCTHHVDCKHDVTVCPGQVFTRGLVLSYAYGRCLRFSVCVRVCVNHELVRAITHYPCKLGPPKLDQMCKRPRLRSLLFCIWSHNFIQNPAFVPRFSISPVDFVFFIILYVYKI